MSAEFPFVHFDADHFRWICLQSAMNWSPNPAIVNQKSVSISMV